MNAALASALVSAALVYLSLCAVLYFFQEGFIFFPAPNDPRLLEQYRSSRIEIPSDGATLEGWWLDNPGATSGVTLIYFGGNAEDVLTTASTAIRFNARRVLLANYRGYGGSTGSPGQKALYGDALAIYEYALRRDVRADQIVVMGRSLGSALASMLAGSRTVGATVLITPFDSLAAVAARHYRLLPVRALLKHPFPSAEWAGRARAPALFLAASHDRIVPSLHAQKLFAAWQGPREMSILEGVGHNDIQDHPDYLRLINAFLATVAAQ